MALRYTPALDGLRAFAVLSVMLFHQGLFPIGWIGVPLFFVLSGYLITSILRADRGSSLSDYSGRFYWRRTIRIFPLYYAYLALNAAICVALGISLEGYGWFIAYLGNHRIGDMAPNVPGGQIGHLWSLAVEEQFYLIWPLVVFFVPRLWPIAIALIVAAPIVRELILQSTGNPYLTIVTLPSCMDMLGAGALIALVKDRRLLVAMAVVGLGICGWSFRVVPFQDFALTTEWVPRAHILYTGLALLFAPLIVVAGRIRALEWAPLTATGRISYGLYIWHMLAFAVVHKLGLPPALDAIGGFALAYVVAAASWHFFEKPLLRYKDKGWGAPAARPVETAPAKAPISS